MNQFLSNRLTVRVLVLALSALFPCAGRMQGAAPMKAREISGTIFGVTVSVFLVAKLAVSSTSPKTSAILTRIGPTTNFPRRSDRS